MASGPRRRLLQSRALPARTRKLHRSRRRPRRRHLRSRKCSSRGDSHLATALRGGGGARAGNGSFADCRATARACVRVGHFNDGVQPSRLLPRASTCRRSNRTLRHSLGIPVSRQLGGFLLPLSVPRDLRGRRGAGACGSRRRGCGRARRRRGAAARRLQGLQAGTGQGAHGRGDGRHHGRAGRSVASRALLLARAHQGRLLRRGRHGGRGPVASRRRDAQCLWWLWRQTCFGGVLP
mmetsp:Transcript_45104/g.111845  ORF Transcript_45104/g.111845 Transcript_45104/m.111845 type:complete len:237 (+) Transcript_45104:1260-1970(+)